MSYCTQIKNNNSLSRSKSGTLLQMLYEMSPLILEEHCYNGDKKIKNQR